MTDPGKKILVYEEELELLRAIGELSTKAFTGTVVKQEETTCLVRVSKTTINTLADKICALKALKELG